jgi:hypothetical protein
MGMCISSMIACGMMDTSSIMTSALFRGTQVDLGGWMAAPATAAAAAAAGASPAAGAAAGWLHHAAVSLRLIDTWLEMMLSVLPLTKQAMEAQHQSQVS